LISSNDIIC
jgi:hypothetical protein